MSNNVIHCPVCSCRLYPKRNGLACLNHKCVLHWKLGGWAFRDSAWYYSDNISDRQAAWDIRHGYTPRNVKIHRRHFNAMLTALEKVEDIVFVIQVKHCGFENEGVLE